MIEKSYIIIAAAAVVTYGLRLGGLLLAGRLPKTGRFKKFSRSQIKDRHYNLDIAWLRDDSLEDPANLPEPLLLAGEAITELNACVDRLQEILDLIDQETAE